ncbi:MAG: ABC transporter permease [Clostridia bacterium]|nr:ABC transporter permease [Clostridia bacterium]
MTAFFAFFKTYLLDYFVDSLAFGATFMYGSTGETLTEKAGHLNLGIPGIMCMGGAGGCLVLSFIGASGLPPFLIVILGILGAFAMGVLMGLIYSFLTVTLRANQNVTGLALTTFGVGLMKVIMSNKKLMVAQNYLIIPKEYFRFPFASRQDSLQRLGVMFFLAVIITIAASYFLYRTKTGLNLRAVGENPATADSAGINVSRYKYLATCIGSGISGLGGLYYIVDYMASNEAYLSIEAYGWLSIALVIFVLWRPHLTIIGSFLFSVLLSCSSFIATIPGVTPSMSAKPLMRMLPYVFTIIVLILSSIRNKRENQPPSSLGLSYFREER